MRILLTCAGGMSTSMLATKMEKVAKAQGKDYQIWAVDQGVIQTEIGNFDVLLLAPQIRHTLKKMISIVGDSAVVDLIKPADYGRGNVEAILLQAENLYNNRKDN